MRARDRSRTAEAAALQRALHMVFDDEPKVLVDDQALRLLPRRTQAWLGLPAQLMRPWIPRTSVSLRGMGRMRGQIVVRARYAEDALAEAVAAGVAQYVVLSAGLDTFALRRTGLQDRLRIFEVDRIATQRWKRRLLRGEIPSNLRFVAVDFERERIDEALRAATFDPSRPAFFSWLGTTYYLTREAIRATLRSLREIASPSSELVCDYWTEDPGLDWQSQMLLSGVRMAVAAQREPMLSFFAPPEIERLAREIGYEVLANVSPTTQRRNYLRHRSDNLDVPDFAFLLHLRVP